jgi:hypothetical protein
MDEILDSNVYLNDLKFQGTQFPELFAYLRRTGSTLIVPDMVLQEVLERYKERLRDALSKAKTSWTSFVGIKMSETSAQFPHVDFDKELQEFKSRLLSPAPNVTASHYTDTCHSPAQTALKPN